MSNTDPHVQKRPSLLLLSLIYLVFVSLGLPDSVLGVAWPPIRASLALPLELAGILIAITTLLSATSGFLIGRITKAFGTGPVVLVSCLMTASGLLIYANAPSFWFLALAAIPLGLGGGGVDASINAYVAKHYRSSHMSWLHSFWGVGATLGPLVMTLAIASPATWRAGYLALAVAQFALSALFVLTLRLWKRNDHLQRDQHEAENGAPGTNTANSAAGWLSVMNYFVYVAVEISVGVWANSLLVLGRHVAPETAGLWISAYYGSIMFGRMLNGFALSRWGNRTMIAAGLALAFAGSLLFFVPFLVDLPLFSLAGLILLGLGLSPIFPCLMHETPRRFTSSATPVVIGRQVGASYLGGALLPSVLGLAMAHLSLELLAPTMAILTAVLFFMVQRLNLLSASSGAQKTPPREGGEVISEEGTDQLQK